ncbi:MAG: ATP synthase F1 subunit delta [Muribaculaceae bacterium]|nr:ATP synthase F1 subunit delta [Muribaculaceae bacterium]
MDKGLLPRRYAKALYEVATESGDAQKLYTVMQTLDKAFADTPAMSATLANPFVSDADKTELLTTAAQAADNPVFINFLKLLEKNHRTDLARQIALAYVDIYRSENSIYRIDVVSAAPLSDGEKQRLSDMVAKHLGEGTLEFNYSVDPALIGGFTVTVNSERLDASVSNRLNQLRQHLMA